VALRPGGRLAGGGAVMPQAGGCRQGEMGVTIAGGTGGTGTPPGAVRLLPGCLFTARGGHRVTACCDPREAAPAALPERPGMRREGHLRQGTRAGGGWTDDLVYALLHDERQSG
jgi:aminoglycoside 6'-N-acetyltransferase